LLACISPGEVCENLERRATNLGKCREYSKAKAYWTTTFLWN